MKTLLILTLLIGSLYAEAKVYFGASYNYLNESFTSGLDYEGSASALKIKAGYGDISSYAVEFTVGYIDNNTNIYSSNDKEKYDFNVYLIKAFDLGIFLNPFLKGGFGTGYLKTSNMDNVAYGSFNTGFGVYIPLNDYIDIEVGYEYQYLSYEREKKEMAKSYTSHVNGSYIGFNIRY